MVETSSQQGESRVIEINVPVRDRDVDIEPLLQAVTWFLGNLAWLAERFAGQTVAMVSGRAVAITPSLEVSLVRVRRAVAPGAEPGVMVVLAPEDVPPRGTAYVLHFLAPDGECLRTSRVAPTPAVDDPFAGLIVLNDPLTYIERMCYGGRVSRISDFDDEDWGGGHWHSFDGRSGPIGRRRCF